ncbi:MAG: hypothetical protein MUC50_17810, partial [Myxococcota bacterium]|nr:hypothetical protein [Myxococcota bacterium]
MRAVPIFLTLLSLLCLMGGGCAPAPLVRVATAVPSIGPPRIARIVDLGGLAPIPDGVLDIRHSDSVLTPGEWVAVVGKNLDNSETKIEACGVEAMAVGHLQGGSLLVRLPRSKHWDDHGGLTLTTPLGSDRVDIACGHAVVVSDMRDNALKLWRATGSEEQPLEEEPGVVSLPRSGPIALGDGGALLYAAGRSSAPLLGRGHGPMELFVIHVAAVPQPTVESRTQIEGKGQIVGAAVDDPRRLLALAFENELVLLSLDNPTAPRVVGRLSMGESLGSAACTDGPVFMSGANQLTLLDSVGNTVVLVDLADPTAPRIAQQLALSEGATGSVTIAMTDHVDEAGRVHVLTGTNVSLARMIARGKTDASTLVKAPPGLATVELRDGRVSVVNKIQFSGEWIPVDLALDPDGGVLVSVVGMDVDKLLSIEGSAQGLLKMIGALKDTVQFGQVWRV